MSDEYARWNEALATHLLQSRPGRPFFLYVDRSVLADASGLLDEGEALFEFTAAVRVRCAGEEPFAWCRAAAHAWRKDGSPGPPPFLAVLAFTVLAAAERTTSHFQYYDDLNRLLGRPPHVRMPGGFDRDVPSAFLAFNAWLEEERTYGTPTASTHPHWSNVGWPLSQALLRPADSRELLALLGRSGLAPDRGADGAALLRRISPFIRLMGESPSRRRLLDALDRFPEMLRELLEREYKAWDGQDEGGAHAAHRLDLRLAHEEGYGEWWLVGRRPADTTFATIRIDGRDTAVRGRNVVEVQYADPFALVGRGVVGTTEDSVVVRGPRAGAKWFRIDRDAGGWLEQSVPDASVEQLRLIPSHHREASGMVSAGMEQLDTAPEGWTLWRVPVGGAVSEPEHHVLPARPPQLEGGLCIDPQTRTYLSSQRGAPLLTGLSEGERVQLDGSALVADEGRAVLPRLPPGDHVLSWSSGGLTLRALDRLRSDLVVEPVISWSRDARGLRLRESDTTQPLVCGAWFGEGVDPHRPFSKLPFPIQHIWVVGDEGQLAKREVRPLDWATSLGLGATETDVRRGLNGLDFRPAFALAFKTKSSAAFIVQVTANEAEMTRDRDVTPLERQQLVQRLLTTGFQPLDKEMGRKWKKTLARLMTSGGW